MDMFSMGLIDQPMAMKMLEVGGLQRMTDIIKAAEKKAQRENIKMKQLLPQDIQQAQQAHQQEILGQLAQHMQQAQDPAELAQLQQMQAQAEDPSQVQAPSVVPVADFDVHELHIQVHNQFRMMQEYETLPPEIQQQFEAHVAEHQQYIQQQAMQQFLAQVPSDGTDGSQQTDQAPGAPPQPGEGPPASLPGGEPGGPAPAGPGGP
jgi:neutral trehalase